MSRFIRRLPSIAVLIALSSALAACSGGGLSNWDPTDMLDFLDTKKKLPGERKPVFPDGVPGLQPGVPREYYRGAQAEPDAAPVAEAPAEPKETKSRKAAKSAPKRAAARPAVQVAPADENVSPDEGEPAAVAAPPPSAKPKITRRRTTAPPPDAEPAPVAAAPAPAQAASPFPAPLPSGTFSR